MQRGGFSTEVSHNLMVGGHVQDTVEVFFGGRDTSQEGEGSSSAPSI